MTWKSCSPRPVHDHEMARWHCAQYSEWTELEHQIAKDVANAVTVFNHGMDMVDLKHVDPSQTPLQFNKALAAVESIVSAE